MTCIAGIKKGNKVWIGGDSAATSGNMSQLIIADKKVFVKGEFAFGVCGSPKVMDVLRDKVKIPKQSMPDNRKYITVSVLPEIKQAFRQSGCMERNKFGKEIEEIYGMLLFGYRGSLYRMESNFQIITTAYGFDAVGSGQDIALGHMHSTSSSMLNNPKKRILKALEASAINNAGVRPPFAVVCVG